MFEINRHKIEKAGKILVLKLILFFTGKGRKRGKIKLGDIKKIFIFRLDERIGNGLLLLPLINGIRYSLPKAEVHILIHNPVARLLESFYGDQLDTIWPYKQKELLHKPWKMIKLIYLLKTEKFDVVINCTNPDNFSTSQGIFGRMLKGKKLIGFWSEKEGNFLNDIQVHSSTQKHYSDAMLDLWRYFDPHTKFISSGLKGKDNDHKPDRKVLFWLGATTGKELPAEIVEIVANEIKTVLNFETDFALGPADNHLLRKYRNICKNNIIIWNAPLEKTAEFFQQYILFISTDTGPMHLAGALGMNMINIFTRVNIKQYGYENGKNQFSVRMIPGEDDLNNFKTELHHSFELMNKHINLIV